jgi:hypothetical protein
VPHALSAVPVTQDPAEQQPLHDDGSHAHPALVQCRPVPQLPLVHVPPQPSSPPHATPVQLGVHPQTPDCAPLHARGLAHSPPPGPWQHGCPLPPQPPHAGVPHAPPVHAVQTTPPAPHAPADVPAAQTEMSQHPAHDVASHTQRPDSQRCPPAHAPFWQMPPHPSLAPHALPPQLGVHPQTPAVPPCPQ